MAYATHSDRDGRSDAFLKNPCKNEKYHTSCTGPVSRVPWNTDHARSYSDVPIKSSPAAVHRTPTSATLPTSPALLRSKNQTSQRSVKDHTCWFWGMQGHCKLSEEICLYAHHYTGKMAQAPIQVDVNSKFSLTSLIVAVPGQGLTLNCTRTQSRWQKRVESSSCLHQLATGAFNVN